MEPESEKKPEDVSLSPEEEKTEKQQPPVAPAPEEIPPNLRQSKGAKDFENLLALQTPHTDNTDSGNQEKTEEKPEQEHPPAMVAPAHKAGKVPVVAVVVAILIALGLAAVTVYAYMKTKDDNKATDTSSSTQQQTTTPATAGDVDQTDKDIDGALNEVNASEDFGNSDLSDSGLGL